MHKVDDSLKICRLDGLIFKSDSELNNHMKMHELQLHIAEDSAMNQMLMAGVVSGVGIHGMIIDDNK